METLPHSPVTFPPALCILFYIRPPSVTREPILICLPSLPYSWTSTANNQITKANGQFSILILLELLATFDTADYSLLIEEKNNIPCTSRFNTLQELPSA